MKNSYSSKPNSSDYKFNYEKLDEVERMKPIMNPGHVDEGKWDEAKKISHESYGEIRWPFVMWIYKHKLGGK